MNHCQPKYQKREMSQSPQNIKEMKRIIMIKLSRDINESREANKHPQFK